VKSLFYLILISYIKYTLIPIKCYYFYLLCKDAQPSLVFVSTKTLVSLYIELIKSIFNKKGNKNSKSFTDQLLQIILLSDFLWYYIGFCTPIGIFFTIFSIFCFFNGLEDGPFWFICLVLYYLTMTFSAGLALYFMVQFSKCRALLRELIGNENFSLYVGDNQGSRTIARLALLGYGTMGFCYLGDHYKEEHNVKLSTEKAEAYVRLNKEGGSTPNPDHIHNILTMPVPSMVKVLTDSASSIFKSN
jgi:hypothetical protein